MERLLLQVPGGWLRVDAETFARCFEPTPAAATAAPERLLTAEEISAITSVPASWFEEKARRAEIPFVALGKYPRFRLSDLIAALERRPDHRACDRSEK